MVALPFIPEVDHNFIILNRTPYILLHIWIPHPMPISSRFRNIWCFSKKVTVATLNIFLYSIKTVFHFAMKLLLLPPDTSNSSVCCNIIKKVHFKEDKKIFGFHEYIFKGLKTCLKILPTYHFWDILKCTLDKILKRWYYLKTTAWNRLKDFSK